MRKWLVVASAGVLVAAIPLTVWAASGGGNTAVNCQTVAWRTASLSTSSSSFATIPDLKPTVSSIFPMSITVSAVVSGEPVAFRLQDVSVAGSKIVQPGIAPFVTSPTGANSFSYTWTDPGISSAVRGHQFLVQWKRTSPVGTSTLKRADIVVLFESEQGACRG
ncbi:MAG: hypothetical protein M3Q23_13020 [Actinomycetota bacterium]|nr:hypothetical protein [Actinomycetota bacterium]